MWSTKTYQLLRGVQIFDRNITEAILVSGTLVACGRNALQASDRCGLDEGLQGWRGALEDSTENLKPGSIGEGGAGGNQKGTADFAIFRLGPPIRAARGVAGLSANRLVIFVLRGAIWSVEIWQG